MTFHKYQNGPNCIFLAFVPAQLRSLTDHLCEIGHRFLAGENPGMRLRRIDTESESRCYGIPTGSFLLVDTGSLIPELIQRHDLKYFTLERRSGHFRVLKSAKFSKDYHRIALPEEYFCDGAPYVVHLRKGSKKQKDHCYGPELFAKDVQHRLDSMT
jgi:hypothetical protein